MSWSDEDMEVIEKAHRSDRVSSGIEALRITEQKHAARLDALTSQLRNLPATLQKVIDGIDNSTPVEDVKREVEKVRNDIETVKGNIDKIPAMLGALKNGIVPDPPRKPKRFIVHRSDGLITEIVPEY